MTMCKRCRLTCRLTCASARDSWKSEDCDCRFEASSPLAPAVAVLWLLASTSGFLGFDFWAAGILTPPDDVLPLTEAAAAAVSPPLSYLVFVIWVVGSRQWKGRGNRITPADTASRQPPATSKQRPTFSVRDGRRPSASRSASQSVGQWPRSVSWHDYWLVTVFWRSWRK